MRCPYQAGSNMALHLVVWTSYALPSYPWFFGDFDGQVSATVQCGGDVMLRIFALLLNCLLTQTCSVTLRLSAILFLIYDKSYCNV